MNECCAAAVVERDARIRQLTLDAKGEEAKADGYKEQYHDLYRRFETLRYMHPEIATELFG